MDGKPPRPMRPTIPLLSVLGLSFAGCGSESSSHFEQLAGAWDLSELSRYADGVLIESYAYPVVTEYGDCQLVETTALTIDREGRGQLVRHGDYDCMGYAVDERRYDYAIEAEPGTTSEHWLLYYVFDHPHEPDPTNPVIPDDRELWFDCTREGATLRCVDTETPPTRSLRFEAAASE